MRSRYIKFICNILFLTGLGSCVGKNTDIRTTDPYVEVLKDSLIEMQVSSGEFPETSFPHPHRIGLLADSNLIVADDSDKSIILLDDQGEVLFRGGGEGRGPEEFLSIGQLHIGYNNLIFVLDPSLFRITAFEVKNDEINHKKIFSYKNPPSLTLTRIYVSETGVYGVFREHKDVQKPHNRFLLYRLNEEFQVKEELLELPGNELRQLDLGLSDYKPYVDHFILSTTFWDLDGDWFYYITSYQSSIHRYNLRTGDLEVISLFDFEERMNNSDYSNKIIEHYDFIEDDQFWEVLNKTKTLPLFSGFWVQSDKIVLRMFYPAGEDGMMIHIDLSSEEISYFHAPFEFDKLSWQDNRIYGIDFKTDGDYRLRYIDFKKKEPSNNNTISWRYQHQEIIIFQNFINGLITSFQVPFYCY